MSEENKLPALSLKVKNFKWFHDEMVWCHIWSVTFFLRKRRNQEHVFKRGREIIVYHCLLSKWKTKMGWLIYLKTKQTAKSISFAFGYTFEVKIYSKQSAACENESYWLVCRCFNVILHNTSRPGILWA